MPVSRVQPQPADVELILAERSVVVTHRSLGHWRQKFGAGFARRFRRRRPNLGETWHLGEVLIWIRRALRYLWRAVDQHGVVLDKLVQEKRDGAAAKRSYRRLLKDLWYPPKRYEPDAKQSNQGLGIGL